MSPPAPVGPRGLRRVLVVVALAALTVVLGVWGLGRLPQRDAGVTDTLYETLQLFFGNWQAPDAGLPWQLDVARFLGPLVVASALVFTALALARERVQRLRTRLFARGHVLVVGVGEHGGLLARALRDSRRVVGLDVDPANTSRGGMAERGVPVVIGDGRDPAVLRSVRADRAEHVVMLAGDDSTNLEVLAALRRVVPSEHPVPLHVAIESPILWSELHRVALATTRAPRRVEIFNIPDRVAARMVEGALGDEALTGPQRSVLVHGSGATAARVTVRSLRSRLLVDDPEVLLTGPDADEGVRVLRETDPWVFGRARVRVLDASEYDLAVAGADVLFVCGLPEADTLATAFGMVRRTRADARILLAVGVVDAARALREAGVDHPRLQFVSTRDLFGEQLLADAGFEQIARGMHADYLARQRALGNTVTDGDALRPWDELAERHRQSNRRFADGVAETLAVLGAELTPLTGRAVGELPVSDAVLEELARKEHDRWCRDQRRDGWQPTDGDKDPERKLHPMLRPWEELSEHERDKDRDAMRALPELLASVGYEIVVPAPPAEPVLGNGGADPDGDR